MEIAEKVKEHNVVDYDFMFHSGNKLAVTVDEDAGDNLLEESDRYRIVLVAKPSLSEPDAMTDPETIEVFKTHLAVKATCRRKQRQPTEEELFNVRKSFHEVAKLVQ